MKIIKFLTIFTIIFLTLSTTLLIKIDYSYYQTLNFNLVKPSINFFNILNLIYIFLLSISLSEITYIYQKDIIEKNLLIKVFINIISFILIKIFFNMHNLLFTLITSLILFISLLYLYEKIAILNEKSTKYLDINVLYSLLLTAFFFCIYILNSI